MAAPAILLDSCVFVTISATQANNVTLLADKLLFTPPSPQPALIAIPFRNIIATNGFKLTTYSAGQVKKIDVTITNASVADNKIYSLFFTKVPPSAQTLIEANPLLQGNEQITVSSGTGATGTTVATAYAAQINLLNSQGGSFFTATSAANVLTVIASSALADFTCSDLSSITTSIAQNQAYIAPAGTYAIVSAVNSAAVTGHTYDTYSWRFTANVDGKYAFNDTIQHNIYEGRVFVDTAATNYAAFIALIAAYNDGSSLDSTSTATLKASTLKYLGIV